MPTSLTDVESVSQRILLIRGQKVMLDTDLADLYGVPTKRFNEQVKRNLDRFPADFMFQLTEDEYESLRSQSATLKIGRGQRRKYLPYALPSTVRSWRRRF
ncbi:MAG: ORF6N domain-containing protein [Gallionella sp.]|nr:ORF6N domain-containing protein [Gallionella sp.]